MPDNWCECQLSAATAVKISEPKIIRRSLIIKLEGSLLKLGAEETLPLGEDDAEDGIVEIIMEGARLMCDDVGRIQILR